MSFFRHLHLCEFAIEILIIKYSSLTFTSIFFSGIFAGLIDLKLLDVSHNNLTHIDYDIFKHVENLEYIDLSYNKLALIYPSTYPLSIFANCSRIMVLDLAYNQISRFSYNGYKNTKLENLYLDGNKITSITVSKIFLIFFFTNDFIIVNAIQN